MEQASSPAGVGALTPLAKELGDLKRLRDAASPNSLAERLFRRAWEELCFAPEDEGVALGVTADAIAAARLGGIDAAVLAGAGCDADVTAAVLGRSFDSVSGPIEAGLAAGLRERLGLQLFRMVPPEFVAALIRQPRAGATCPGKPRIVLEPPESHGDHCLVVAVLGTILAGHYGADPATVFVAGLAHHLHNAYLPDSGFAGEILLGDELVPLMGRLFERELATLPPRTEAVVRRALAVIGNAETPEGRAFNAADVIDRVLQMQHYHQVADFTVDQALEDLELVHAGPLQSFHHAVLAEAGLP